MVIAATGAGTILVQLGAVLVSLGLLGRVARRVGLSPVPLYLLVGLLLGSSGPLDLEVPEGVIDTGSAIGVVLLLFLLGLEYSPRELFSSLRTHAPSGAVDLALNFTPGVLAGLVLGWDPIEAVLLGGVTYISSSGIIAKLVGDLGRTANRETPVIVSILVIEDLAMAFFLPLAAGLLAGGTVLATTGSIALSLLLVAVIMLAALHVGPTLSRFVFSPSSEVLLFTVLGLALLVAGVAEQLQVSAAVGAFLVGIALSGPTAERSEPLLTPVRDLFAASFFVFFALEIDLARVPEVIVPALALAVVTGTTKLATGWFAARRSGIGRPGRWRAGTTLIARGEFSVIIAELGRTAGLTEDLSVLAAAYVLVLAILGPLTTRLVDVGSSPRD